MKAALRSLNRRLVRKFGETTHADIQDGVLTLTGSLAEWDDLVAAGLCAAKSSARKHCDGVVNNIVWTGGTIPPPRLPTLSDTSLDGLSPDVLVIGGGIIGAAITRELSRYQLDILLVEKEHDIAMQASSRNDGMVHPGIDLRPGTLKYAYNRRGNAMFEEICASLGVDFRRCGQLLCFSGFFMPLILAASLLWWKINRLPAKLLDRRALRAMEPHLAPSLTSALFFPTAGIVCPYNLAIAYAENAAENGAKISLDTAVLGMEFEQNFKTAHEAAKITAVHTNRGTLYPKIVVNAAGVFSDTIAAMAGDTFFSIHPRKGTNTILDKKYTARLLNTNAVKIDLFSRGFSSMQKAHTKGGGLVSTVDGNVLAGPDARETPERENYATERSSIDALFAKFGATSENLNKKQIITYFTGVRAANYDEDFVVQKGRRTENIVHAAAIQSPGITAAPAIAVDVAKMAVELLEKQKNGAKIAQNPAFNGARRCVTPRPSRMKDDERAALIAKEPEAGRIICRCEEVSAGEIRAALHRPVPCDTLDGVKRRVRPGMGRCQGAFCGPLVHKIIAEECGIPLEHVTKNGAGSEIVTGRDAP